MSLRVQEGFVLNEYRTVDVYDGADLVNVFSVSSLVSPKATDAVSCTTSHRLWLKVLCTNVCCRLCR
jgi:hypothetical protein